MCKIFVALESGCVARAFAPAFYPLGLSVSILLLLGGHFGGIASDFLATVLKKTENTLKVK